MTQTVAQRFARNSALLSSAAVASFAFRFLRNIALAHLLSQADYGKCVLLSAVMASVQLLSDLGLDRMLIQNRSTDNELLQATLTALSLARAILSGLLLFALAPLLSSALGMPDALPAFRYLSLTSMLQGLFHLDSKRLQREHRFIPDIIVSVGGDAVEFSVAIAAAYIFRTYAILPAVFLCGALTGVLLSHWVAERRFAIGLNRQVAVQALQFGYPLMLSGLIVLLASQADRMVVGAAVGLQSVAIYGAAMTIISTPGILIGRVGLSISMPFLTEAAENPELFSRRFRSIGVMAVMAAVSIFVPLMLTGTKVIALVFGARYAPPTDLVWIIAMGQTGTLLRVWPNVAALALGDTRNLAISNIPRLIGIVLAVVVTHFGADLVEIAGCFALAEVVALASALGHLHWRRPGTLRGLALFLALPCLFVALGVVAARLFAGDILKECAASFVLVTAFLGTSVSLSEDARGIAERVWRQMQKMYSHGSSEG
ncbi:MAG TPA: oligosaccharide flippase family protein [Rhizomicrobium sp.]|jgi:O-antigen/teichoic acid export membrane protein|nr:oligosaccharide flippase family protein [Rhizomicrobium sp.]